MNQKLPFPPLEMRELVGPTDVSDFDNPLGDFIFNQFLIPPEAYRSIFDFGCGCGRNARKLMQLRTKPEKYLGIDLHQGMIKWCQNNLSTCDRDFQFKHYNTYNIGFNPKGKKQILSFPSDKSKFSLIIAISVFTHIVQDFVVDFLKECKQVMSPESYFVSSWFLFDKKYYPMMQEFQNALYINTIDPTNAVIYDYQWLFQVFQEVGLTPVNIFKPKVKGFQWNIILRHSELGIEACDLPEDDNEFGIIRASANVENPDQIGL